MTDRATTVYIVDDDPSLLRALARLLGASDLDFEAFDSPHAFLDAYDPDRPGCVILDISMPELNGLELQQELGRRGGLIPIIFLTGHGDISTSVKAMKGGAVDFLTKPVDGVDLLEAVHNAIAKGNLLQSERAHKKDIEERLGTLTPRETEVLRQIVAGRLNKQIAADLGTVEKTIKVHRGRVMHKMKARSLAELVRLVERVGVFPDGPETSA